MKRNRSWVVASGVVVTLAVQLAQAQSGSSGAAMPAVAPVQPAPTAQSAAAPASPVPVGSSAAQAVDPLAHTGTMPAASVAPVAAPAVAPVAPNENGSAIQAVQRRNLDLEARVARLEEKQLTLEARAGEKKSTGVQVTPYGFVKLGVAYDTSRTAYGDLSFYVLPDSKAGGGKRELTAGARESRIGVKLAAPEFGGIVATGQFEADWCEEAATASKYSPRLRLAFVDLAFGAGWSLRGGQDWDLYVGAQPKIVDASILAGAGHLYGRRPLLRLMKVFKLGQTSSISVKLGAAHGRTQDVDGDGQLDADATGVPSLQGGIVVASTLLGNRPTTLTISGAYGKEKVHLPIPTAATPSDHTKTFDSQLVHASLQFPLTNSLALQGVAWWGKNLDQYYGGVLQGINATTETAIESRGGWGQVVWDVAAPLSLSTGAAVDNPINSDVASGGRTFNSRIFGNAFFKATDAVLIVAEYGYLRTRFKSEPYASNNRAHMALQYTF